MEQDKQWRDDLRKKVAASNDQALLMKQAVLRKEQEEDDKIVEYQRAKAAREAAEEEAADERKRQADLQTAKLVALQEKANDNRSALDELRAKRAFEAQERKERETQLAKKEKADRERDEMMRDRAHAIRVKQAQKAMAIKEEESEYVKIGMNSAKALERDRCRLSSEHEKRLVNRRYIQKQIRDKEEIRAASAVSKFHEGDSIQQDFRLEREKLERKRTEMVQTLAREGVNATYLTEMKRVDIGKIQMR